MPRKKFTRMPKANELIPLFRECGLGLHVLPTYYALMDHANNKTGRCWPSINRLAAITGLCRRTVERHIKALVSAGLVHSDGQGRGKRGRFSVCRYVVSAVLFFASATVRHQGRTTKPVPNKERSKRTTNTPKPPGINRGDREADAARRSNPADSWFFE